MIERVSPQSPVAGDTAIGKAAPSSRQESTNASASNQSVLGADTLDLTILGTTDIHGHIYPTNYFQDKGDEPLGLARVGTLVKQIRAHKAHTLLVDSGDALEGTPVVRYSAQVDTKMDNPMIKAMNALKYDALAVGNHEYNFGIPYLEKARSEAQFPFLSGNVFQAGTTDPVYTPYIIKEIEGARIAILGFTTPGVAIWDGPKVKGKQDFGDILAAARRWIPEIKAKGADVIVVAIHSGLGEPFESSTGYSSNQGVPPENVSARLAESFPEIDAILLGHSHMDLPTLIHHGVILAQAKKWGERLVEVDLKLQKQDGKWKVVARHSRTISTASVPPDPEILEAAKAAHDATVKYLKMPIGSTPVEWSAARSRFEDTPIIDLIQEAQRRAVGAELSAASVMNMTATLHPGQLTTSDIAALYVYQNTLAKVEITGQQLKAYLEHAVRHFNTYAPGVPVFDENLPAYTQDMIQGVDYIIDIRRPVGERITSLTFHGKQVTDDQTFTIALNSYRQNGGGGYDMIKGAPVKGVLLEEIRDQIIELVKDIKVLTPEAVFQPNWKILPEGAIAEDGKHYR